MNRYGLVIVILVLVITATPAAAAPAGFDAAFAGETAFLTLHRGDTGQMVVFFTNTGTTSWVGTTATEVVLSVCVDTPSPQNFRCNVLSPYADFALNWTSPRIYATATQPAVAAGGMATFTYGIKVPMDAALGDHYFRGELVHRATGTPVHPVGYYHLVTVIP
jgi:hypothetical protein